jgi:RNA polymerase primary sigma factor
MLSMMLGQSRSIEYTERRSSAPPSFCSTVPVPCPRRAVLLNTFLLSPTTKTLAFLACPNCHSVVGLLFEVAVMEDPLRTFLRSLNECPKYTRKEERELWVRMRAGELDARDKLIRSQLPWVVTIVSKSLTGRSLKPNVDVQLFLDAIQEGNRGLIHAVGKFNPDKCNTRLTTYARAWVLNYLQRFLSDNRLIHIPKYLWRSNQDSPSFRDVLDIDKEDGSRMIDSYEDTNTDSSLLSDDVRDCMHVLTDRERTIITERANGVTLKALGQRYGISRERVRQIQNKALATLRRVVEGEAPK